MKVGKKVWERKQLDGVNSRRSDWVEYKERVAKGFELERGRNVKGRLYQK